METPTPSRPVAVEDLVAEARAAHSGTRLALVAPPAAPPAPGSTPSGSIGEARRSTKQVRLGPGQVVPGTNYRIARWLGEGSMGVVYEARHTEIDRKVALKVLNLDNSEDPRAVQSFRDEARASARIGAPNIVEVFDFTTLPDGRLAMAMELLQGHSLHQLTLQPEPVHQGRLIGILRQVCKGLAAAHAAGIVHRDIKPENIMLVEREGRPDFVKLVDFGIASVLGEAARYNAGTPLFMAPETMLGLNLDARADIYSLGCAAYDVLAGRPPFVHDDLEELMEAHLHETPRRISELRPELNLNKELEAVIMRCLSKEPKHRYENMAELEAALCEAQIAAKLHSTWDDLPVPEVDPERRERLLRQMPDPTLRHSRRGWFLPALGGLLIGAAALGGLWMANADDARVAASSTAALEPETAQPTEVQQLEELALSAAAQAFYAYPPVDDPEFQTAYMAVLALETIDGDASSQATEKAVELRGQFADTLVRLGDRLWAKPGGEAFAIDYYVQAMMFDPTHERARERASITPGELAMLRKKAALGQFTQAELVAVEPLVVLAEEDEDRRETKLRTLRNKHRKARGVSAQARLDELLGEAPEPTNDVEPIELDASAEDTDDTQGAADTEGLADTEGTDAGEDADTTEAAPSGPTAKELVDKGDAAKRKGDLSGAEAYYHRALERHARDVGALRGLGDVYFERAKYSRALKYRKMAAVKSPNDAELQLGLGDAYFKVLDYGNALEAYRKSESLGNAQASKRIAKVEARMGK